MPPKRRSFGGERDDDENERRKEASFREGVFSSVVVRARLEAVSAFFGR
jgi:hypothetical protein